MMLAFNIAPILFMFALETLTNSPNKITATATCMEPPPLIDHGYPNVQFRSMWWTDSVIRYTCHRDYVNSRYDSARCNESGQWVLDTEDDLGLCDVRFPKCYPEENYGRRKRQQCTDHPYGYIVLAILLSIFIVSLVRRYIKHRNQSTGTVIQPPPGGASWPPPPPPFQPGGPPGYTPSMSQQGTTGGDWYPLQPVYPTQEQHAAFK